MTKLHVYQGATRLKSKGLSVRVLCGNLQRGDGFQAGLDVLLLTTVLNVEVLASDVLSLDRSLPAAAALALAALRARRRGGADVGAGGRRGVQHLEASNRNEGEQTAGLLLGVQREVAEDVLLMGTGRSRRSRSQAAPLILKQHVGRVSAANSGQNLDRGTEEISAFSAKRNSSRMLNF